MGNKKKKNPFKIIFSCILLLIIVAILAPILYLYFAKNVNTIKFATDLYSLKNSSEPNKFEKTDEDLTISDKLLDQTIKVSLTEGELAYVFTQYASDDSYEFINVEVRDKELSVIVKLSTKDIKSKLDLPDYIYVKSTSKIEAVGSNEYNAEPVSLKIADLSISGSKNFCNMIGVFDKSISYEQINNEITEYAMKAILEGFYENFNTAPLLWGFENGEMGYNIAFYFADVTAKKNITMTDSKFPENSSQLEYTILDGVIILPALEREGYQGYWESLGVRINYVDSISFQDYSLSAHWETIDYSIEYDLNGGAVSSPLPLMYNIESCGFTLENPTKTDYTFIGWDDGSGTPVKDYTVNYSLKKNLHLKAFFAGDVNTVTLIMDQDDKVGEFQLEKNAVLTKSVIENNLDMSSFGGYEISDWYTDVELSNLYTYDTPIVMDYVLYADYTYSANKMEFYDYYDVFMSALNTKSLTINSKAMLKAWIEFVYMYLPTEKVMLNLSYTSNAHSEISAVHNEVYNSFHRNYGAVVGYSGGLVYAYVPAYVDPMETLDPTKASASPQQDYALHVNREYSEKDFARDRISRAVDVHNTTQLVYALENGYSISNATGVALETYDKARSINKKIIRDSMTDIEKLAAIYEWLALNVSYDNAAAVYSDAGHSAQECFEYRSWFAEGALLDGISVCEGYAKAAIILCNLENIPCVMVGGNGHAWNKVMVDGKWYVFDATHADLTFSLSGSKYEVLSYRQFLVTDEYKSTLGFTSNITNDFECNTVFDYFAYKSFEYNGSKYSLTISNQQEAEALASFIKSNPKTVTGATYRTFCYVANGNANTISGYIKQKLQSKGFTVYTTSSPLTGANISGNSMYIILIK